MPVSQLAEKLQQVTGVDTVVFDGIITQRIVILPRIRTSNGSLLTIV
jgi:hypothetical protein